MKSIQLPSLVLIGSALILTPICPAASMFTSMHVFGDSLSDSGNVSLATAGGRPGEGYYQGHYSNGPIWTEQLATGYLGLAAPAPSLAGGSAFAFGGAATAGGSSGVPSVTDQVNGFIGAGGGFTPTDLVVLWGGANDFLREGVTDPSVPVANLVSSIHALAAAGATSILVPNLPDLSDTPAISLLGNAAASAGMHALTVGFNTLLDGQLTALRSSLGIDLMALDVFGLGKDVAADPAAFGVGNVVDSAYLTGDTANADDYIYWDEIHPTEAMHSIIAEEGARVLGVPEPSATMFLAVGLFGILFQRRRTS
ncbi:MAG: SGNH/GDSL hydrolase family protein [Verrucomicrobiales bacterium]